MTETFRKQGTMKQKVRNFVSSLPTDVDVRRSVLAARERELRDARLRLRLQTGIAQRGWLWAAEHGRRGGWGMSSAPKWRCRYVELTRRGALRFWREEEAALRGRPPRLVIDAGLAAGRGAVEGAVPRAEVAGAAADAMPLENFFVVRGRTVEGGGADARTGLEADEVGGLMHQAAGGDGGAADRGVGGPAGRTVTRLFAAEDGFEKEQWCKAIKDIQRREMEEM